MKNRIFSLVTVAVIALASCNQMSEQKYNDTVVNMYSAYSNRITAEAGELSSSTDKARSLSVVKAIQKTTDSCITVMNGLKPSEAAKDFHQKVLTVFQTVKNEFVPAAQKLAEVQGSQDVEAANKLVEAFNIMATKLDKVETDAITAQKDYGQKVGMQIK